MILGLRRASSRKASRKFLRHASTEINGDGKTAVLFGGFGFTERAMAKHAALYSEHGFDGVGEGEIETPYMYGAEVFN